MRIAPATSRRPPEFGGSKRLPRIRASCPRTKPSYDGTEATSRRARLPRRGQRHGQGVVVHASGRDRTEVSMTKKSPAQLNREIAEALGKSKPKAPKRSRSRALLPADWPDVGRRIVLDAARWYYQEMNKEWPVSDVLLESAVQDVGNNLEREDRDRAGRLQIEDVRPSWYARYESGKLDDEIKRAIVAWSAGVKHGAPVM